MGTINGGISKRKKRAAAFSVYSNTFLVLAKLAIGILTGSVAVISEAVHSAMDLLASLIAFVAVSFSDHPPDAKHPYGHGKIENLSGAIEALLIFGAVLFIGYEAIEKLIHGNQVQNIYLGAIVMGVSAGLNTAVSWYLQRVGEQTESEALLADAAHLRTDVYTSLGVLAGLVAVHFTKITWLDPLAALLVGLLIAREAWVITRRAVGDLLDQSLPADERSLVEQVIQQRGLTFHDLRSAKSGAMRKIDLHLEVDPAATAAEIHAVCDDVEKAIACALPGAQVLIHPEPRYAPSQDLRGSIRQTFERHCGRLFVDFSDLCIHEYEPDRHIAARLRLGPGKDLRDLQRIDEHLCGHLKQILPNAALYLHPF